jgi:uroporphyrin-III C-methyltransferase
VSTAEAGKVYLVGAGPGDPDLLTLKAAQLLALADVVLHDDLVPQAVLDLTGGGALIMSVGKRCRRKKITQAAIHDLMISWARRGLVVVRLKSGDPMIFGRAGEEMDALRAAQVPFEVVPGVTAASAAASLLGVSLTDRRLASRLVVLSGHRAGGRLPEPILCSADEPENAMLAIYMPGNTLAEVTASLLRSGVAATMPCVAVSDASRPEASYRAFRLGGLDKLPATAGPRLLLVGRALEAALDRSPQGDAAGLDSVEVLTALLHLE